MELTGFNDSWWLGLSCIAHSVRPRAQRRVRRAAGPLQGLERRPRLPHGTPDRLGPDRQDPHRGMVAGHPGHQADRLWASRRIWNGPPSSDWLTRLGTWLVDVHASVGIPATTPDHHGVPFSLTEDFVTVYRMHPLIPDDYRFADHQTGEQLHTCNFLRHQRDKSAMTSCGRSVLTMPCIPSASLTPGLSR